MKSVPAPAPSAPHPRFAGKRALVTGGSRGIGRAIAERLAAEGAAVAINYGKSRDEAEAVAVGIEARGGTAFAIEARIGASGAIKKLFATLDGILADRFGDHGLDILVNNAGVPSAVPLTTVTEEDYDRIFAVNTKGAAFVSQAAAARMRVGGRIINIGSGAAKQPGPRNGVYGMSKAALLALTRALAVELGPRGITVNCVSPGFTETDMTAKMLADPAFVDRLLAITALGRLGRPEDIAAVVAFLASDDGGWLTGQWIEATGGYKLVPPV
jgi:NAD(P)-dependent dehydrogenase (short-subunit alcohol dehydrogenase family)